MSKWITLTMPRTLVVGSTTTLLELGKTWIAISQVMLTTDVSILTETLISWSTWSKILPVTYRLHPGIVDIKMISIQLSCIIAGDIRGINSSNEWFSPPLLLTVAFRISDQLLLA
jgi:hypothetical protein